MASAIDLGVDDVLDVVQNVYGIEGDVVRTNRGLQFKFLCVAHEDRDPSAAVNLETGYWNCWACRGGGDLIDLGKHALGKPHRAVRKLLKPDNPVAKAAAVSRRAKAAQAILRPSEKRSERFSPEIPEDYPRGGNFRYLYDRGFNKETLRSWGVRFVQSDVLEKSDGKTFEVSNCYGIPIHSENGSVVGWCYRAGPKSERWFREVRYIYTPGITDVLNKTWFGLWHHRNEEEITVTEGALDAIWLSQCGFPAVAMLGNQAKQVAKIRKLMRFRRVTFFLDHDDTGAVIAAYLGNELLQRGVSVDVVRFASFMTDAHGNPAKDANDLCPLDVELAHFRAIPFTAWRARALAA